MMNPTGGSNGVWGRWGALVVGGLLAVGLASCDGHGVVEPPPSGVMWTRLTPMALEECIYPDVRQDSLAFNALGVDGRPRLAVGPVDGSSGFYVFNYPGPAPWLDFRPRWVRSATLVYQANRNGTYDIWYRDLDNNADRRLTSDPTNESAPAPRPNAPGLVYVEYDNNSSTPGSADLRGRLVLIPDTAAVPLNKIYLTPDTLRCGEPDWDPTGTKLVFSVEDATDLTRHLYTMNLVPGDSLPVQITVGAARDFTPRWSPDGAHIAFTADRTGRWGVWVVNPLGEAKGLKLISFDDKGATVLTPAWTSDGQGLIVTSDGRGGVRSLWLLTNLPPFGF